MKNYDIDHKSIDPNDPTQVLDDFRELGLVVCRGTAVMTVSPPGDGLFCFSLFFFAILALMCGLVC